MSMVILTDTPLENIKVTAPSRQEILEAVEALNNKNRPGITLSRNEGVLFIHGGNQNRVWVSFVMPNLKSVQPSGTLIDGTYSEEDGEIDISVGGEVNPFPLYATVSKMAATDVAIHFMELGTFPPNTRWIGNLI